MSTPWWAWLLIAVEIIGISAWLWFDEFKGSSQRRRVKRQAERRESHAQLQADIMRIELDLGISDDLVPKQIDGVPVTSRPDPGQVERR